MKKTIFAGVLFGLFMLFFVLSRYYNHVQGDYWPEERAAIQHALAQTEMIRADKAERFAWDETYWIVYGVSEQDEQLIAWVGEREVHVERLDDGFSRDQLAASLEQQGTDLIRLIPGVWGEEYAWEAFYRKEETEGSRYYYAFYSFTTGQLLGAYPLPMR